MTHVAWSCDGRKLGAVGIDKVARVWQPEKSVRPLTHVLGVFCLHWGRWSYAPRRYSLKATPRTSTTSHGIPPTRSCSAPQVRETGGSYSGTVDVSSSLACPLFSIHLCISRKPSRSTNPAEVFAFSTQLFSRWKDDPVHHNWEDGWCSHLWKGRRRNQGSMARFHCH